MDRMDEEQTVFEQLTLNPTQEVELHNIKGALSNLRQFVWDSL